MTDAQAVKIESDEANQPDIEELKAYELETEIVLDEESDDTPKSDAVPLSAHLRLKDKLKAHKQESSQTVEEKDREIELLRLRLEQNNQPQASGPPTLEAFDYDDAQYQAAMSAYMLEEARKAAVAEVQKNQQQGQRTAQAQQFDTALDSVLQSHAKQAADLKIRPEDYEESLGVVTQAFGTDGIRHLLTGGALDAATVRYLAKNPAKLSTVAHSLKASPVAGITQLAELKSKLTTRQHKTIPNPDVSLEGGGAGGNSWQTKLDKLRKQRDEKGQLDFQAILALKREAQAAGASVT